MIYEYGIYVLLKEKKNHKKWIGRKRFLPAVRKIEMKIFEKILTRKRKAFAKVIK